MPSRHTHRSEGPRQLTGSSLPHSSKKFNVPLFPYWEIYTHSNSRGIPLLYESGDQTSRFRESKGLAFSSRIPETRHKSILTLSLSYHNFPYRDFGTHDIKQLILPTPEPRYTETLMRSRVDLSTVPSLHRHFGVHNIVNPNAYVSGLLAMKLR
jgi:hypothetical protein